MNFASQFAIALLAIVLLGQAPTPAQPAQPSVPPPAVAAPAASPSIPPPTPSQPPPPRMIPVAPHSPDDLAAFLRIYHAERTLADESSAYIRQAQQHLNEDKSKMDGLNQLLENELIDLHTKESWGSEVRFNPQTEKFEKPLPGPAPGGKITDPSAQPPVTQVPINKDTNTKKEHPQP